MKLVHDNFRDFRTLKGRISQFLSVSLLNFSLSSSLQGLQARYLVLCQSITRTRRHHQRFHNVFGAEKSSGGVFGDHGSTGLEFLSTCVFAATRVAVFAASPELFRWFCFWEHCQHQRNDGKARVTAGTVARDQREGANNRRH